ncbi:MAG: hypothetical protein KJO42_01990, partial [Silicimonas sp.]|nr:hypothetical protein [Silicimonas sp.]
AEARGLSIWRQQSPADASDDPGYRPSDVALIARDPAHAAEVLSSGLWTPLDSDGKVPWTDERANPLSILRGDVFR